MLLEDHLEYLFLDLQALADQLKLKLLLRDMVLFMFVAEAYWELKSKETQMQVI